MVCNVPRIILNMEELRAISPSYWTKFNFLATQNLTDKSEETLDAISCHSPPFWAHILRSVSKLLLTFNASVGCFVYCMMCSRFRDQMSNCFTNLIYSMNKIVRATWSNHFLLNKIKWRTMLKHSVPNFRYVTFNVICDLLMKFECI